MPVSASTSSVASCTRRQASSSQIVRRAVVHVAPPRSAVRPVSTGGHGYGAGAHLDARQGPLRRRLGDASTRARRAGGWTRRGRSRPCFARHERPAQSTTTASACSAAPAPPSARPAPSRLDVGPARRLPRSPCDDGRCTDCGACLEACPGPGLDFTAGAWWRERNDGAPARDFLGPWRRPLVRLGGGPAGPARRSVRRRRRRRSSPAPWRPGIADAVVAVGMDPRNPLEPRSASSAARRRRSPPAAAPSTTSSR